MMYEGDPWLPGVSSEVSSEASGMNSLNQVTRFIVESIYRELHSVVYSTMICEHQGW